MKFLVTLSLLAFATAVQLKIAHSHAPDISALIADAKANFDGQIEEILGGAYEAAGSELDNDLELTEQAIESEEDGDSEDNDEAEEFEEWAEAVEEDMGDTLLVALEEAGGALSDAFEQSLKDFAKKLQANN